MLLLKNLLVKKTHLSLEISTTFKITDNSPFASYRLDSKIIRFWHFLFKLFPLRRTKWFSFAFHARVPERTKNLSIIVLEFIDICEITEVNCTAIKKFTCIVTTFKFYAEYEKNMLFWLRSYIVIVHTPSYFLYRCIFSI